MIDTHCHIHDLEFFKDLKMQDELYNQAIDSGVEYMFCIGTSVDSSRQALNFCKTHKKALPVIGVHPHDSKNDYSQMAGMVKNHYHEVIGIGEIGLDYFYENSPKKEQVKCLEYQLQFAQDYNLPVSFHVRDAFDDFWPIFDNFSNVRGVLHSYTDSIENVKKGLERGLVFGINGISTFTKDKNQQKMFLELPLDKILLETDAPFLTPKPFRGKINIPSYIKFVAQDIAEKRGISVKEVVKTTSQVAYEVFLRDKNKREV